MSVSKFFILSNIEFVFGSGNMPTFAPSDDATSFEEAYSDFAFDDETAAIAEMEDETKAQEEAVAKGDLTDFYSMFVVAGVINDDGSIDFDESCPGVREQLSISADEIYSHFDLALPAFSSPAPSKI
jgi:hypothetical protein